MIKNVKFWHQWEDSFLRKEPTDYARNLRVVDSLYQEARRLGVFSHADPLEGLDLKIMVAKILNSPVKK